MVEPGDRSGVRRFAKEAASRGTRCGATCVARPCGRMRRRRAARRWDALAARKSIRFAGRQLLHPALAPPTAGRPQPPKRDGGLPRVPGAPRRGRGSSRTRARPASVRARRRGLAKPWRRHRVALEDHERAPRDRHRPRRASVERPLRQRQHLRALRRDPVARGLSNTCEQSRGDLAELAGSRDRREVLPTQRLAARLETRAQHALRADENASDRCLEVVVRDAVRDCAEERERARVAVEEADLILAIVEPHEVGPDAIRRMTNIHALRRTLSTSTSTSKKSTSASSPG